MLKRLNKFIYVYAAIFIIAICAFLFIGCNSAQIISVKEVGVSWCKSSNYDDVITSIEDAGGKAKVFDQVKYNDIKYNDDKISPEFLDEYGMLKNEYAEQIKSKPYEKTNVREVVSDYKAVIFSGGPDICPSLYKNPKPWYDYNIKPKFDPARDVSDYILMSYCLDNNIPVMGICRGMQLYSVVSGAEMIQDLPTYYSSLGVSYSDEHTKSVELDGKKVYGNHSVTITDKDSFLYDVYKTDIIEKPFSSHHQAVFKVDPSKTKITAKAYVGGVETVEAVERNDTNVFSIFVQYHPEHSLAAWKDNDADKEFYMSYEDSLKLFSYFLEHAFK